MDDSETSTAAERPSESESTTYPPADNEDHEKETLIPFLGFKIRTLLVDGHLRHFCEEISLDLVKDKLQLRDNDELLMLNFVPLVNRSHQVVVELFFGLKSNMLLLYRRPITGGKFRYHYTAVEATLDIDTVDVPVRSITVKAIVSKSSDDTSVIRWPSSDLTDIYLKSVGKPANAMRGNDTYIFIGPLQEDADDLMNLLMYLVWPAGSGESGLATTVNHASDVYVYFNNTDPPSVDSSVSTFNADDPPWKYLFYYAVGAGLRSVTLRAFENAAYYLSVDQGSDLCLSQNDDAYSMFDVLPSKESDTESDTEEASPSTSDPHEESPVRPGEGQEEASAVPGARRSDPDNDVPMATSKEEGSTRGGLFACIPCIKINTEVK